MTDSMWSRSLSPLGFAGQTVTSTFVENATCAHLGRQIRHIVLTPSGAPSTPPSRPKWPVVTDFITKLEKLGAEATEGPWSNERAKVFRSDGFRIATTHDTPYGRPDARFIASSRNCWDALVRAAEMVPHLLRYIDRVRMGDPTLTSEDFYIETEEAQRRLAALRSVVEGGE